MQWHTADGTDAPGPNDRGLAYGDGLFETIAIREGLPRLLDRHIERLRTGATRLRLPVPPHGEVRELVQEVLTTGVPESGRAVVKLVLTAGDGERGYARTGSRARLFAGLARSRLPAVPSGSGVTLRWCRTRLGRNPALAGIKHLNRLEQVLARAEWNDQSVAEGLMLDTAGCIVCATMSNLFLARDGQLLTPALTHAGVAGVMRAEVLEIADELGIATEVREIRSEDVAGADELFLTNSQFVLWSVSRLGQRQWGQGELTGRIRNELAVRGIFE